MAVDNSLQATELVLMTAIVNGLPASIPSTNVKGPNLGFTGGSTPNNSPWIRISSPVSLGPIATDASGCYEINAGQMNIGVFWPKGTGSQAALSASHEIKELYDANNFNDVTITSVVVVPSPEPEESAWYGVNVNINFEFEGFRS